MRDSIGTNNEDARTYRVRCFYSVYHAEYDSIGRPEAIFSDEEYKVLCSLRQEGIND
jgi:hypothetical protein